MGHSAARVFKNLVRRDGSRSGRFDHNQNCVFRREHLNKRYGNDRNERDHYNCRCENLDDYRNGEPIFDDDEIVEEDDPDV